MGGITVSKTAILVDGGFYRKRAKFLWGEHTPKESADALVTYCMRHLKEHSQKHELYRLFYYDCPPIDKQIYHPLTGTTINMKCSKDSVWMGDFLAELKKKRKVALRLGTLDVGNAVYTLRSFTLNSRQISATVLSLGFLLPEHNSETNGRETPILLANSACFMFKALISSRIRSFISGTPPFGNIIAHKSTAVKKKVAR